LSNINLKYLASKVDIADVVGISGIILAIISLFVALSALNFSKRSYLLKDTYDPLLNTLKEIKAASLVNTIEINVEFLKSLKETYLFLAFNSKEKRLIDSIISSADSLNKFKNTAYTSAEKSLIDVINKKDKLKSNEQHIILSLDLKNEPSKELYTLISDGDFAYQLYSGAQTIICRVGERVTYYDNRAEDYLEDEKVHYRSDLGYYVDNTLDVVVPELEGYNLTPEKYQFFLEGIEKEVYKEFQKIVDWDSKETLYNKFMSEVDKLNNSITNKIKRMLIPNYFWKRNR
jgi:hypothetical protein